jgi:hypothetical protein
VIFIETDYKALHDAVHIIYFESKNNTRHYIGSGLNKSEFQSLSRCKQTSDEREVICYAGLVALLELVSSSYRFYAYFLKASLPQIVKKMAHKLMGRMESEFGQQQVVHILLLPA